MPDQKTASPPDPLKMTDAEVDAIRNDAMIEARNATAEVETAKLILRGEVEPIPGWMPEDLTPERLAELRARAEHAALKVPAAERRQAEIRETRIQARHADIKAMIRAEAASDLDGAEGIITALDAYEAAVKGLCEAVQAHNGRITKWGRLMGSAGIHAIHGEGTGPNALAHMIGEQSVTVGHKIFRRMRAGTLLAVALHRVLATYPREMRKYNVDNELAHDGDLIDSNGRVNVHARIRRDA
ncbi:hypothetical protein [Streptomyces sp. NBC_00878]|uniref:hypothetical protein n=1 Tax=Streptomyces sp. NBC_00878 TaxID=2975854 RepID=UPI002255AC00|nr:hypothetical protein [Streptomyces sp. NBC_00878]MCX4908058.1 hypothetical protein [Streptomyces sp. NBC_00878]